MTGLVKVLEARARDRFRMHLIFSDGQEGTLDLRNVVLQAGSMVQPLQNPDQFARVFVESGIPTWPNGFALDAVALHREMSTAGLLRQAAA